MKALIHTFFKIHKHIEFLNSHFDHHSLQQMFSETVIMESNRVTY